MAFDFKMSVIAVGSGFINCRMEIENAGTFCGQIKSTFLRDVIESIVRTIDICPNIIWFGVFAAAFVAIVD